MECFEQSKSQFDKDLIKIINNVDGFMDKYSNDWIVDKNRDKIIDLLDSMFINKRKYGTFKD